MILCFGLKVVAQNISSGLEYITERKAKAYVEFLASDTLKGSRAGRTNCSRISCLKIKRNRSRTPANTLHPAI